jgi:hypothetical protein
MSRTTAVPKYVALKPTLVATVVEDGAVLLDLDSKYFYALNETAWAIVQLCESTAAASDEIVAQCAAWGAPDDAAVLDFLAELAAQNIVEEAASAQALPRVQFSGKWNAPAVSRQAEPLQRIVTSAFDPSLPLAE